MNKRTAFFAVCAAASALACLAMLGCAAPGPSCGGFHRRADGATCRECVTPTERYAECSATVMGY